MVAGIARRCGEVSAVDDRTGTGNTVGITTGISDAGGRRTVDFRGATALIDERGEGPTVGYLHGPIGCPPRHPFLDVLAERCRIVAPNLPGCTGSDPCDDLRGIHDWVVAVSELVDLAGLAGRPLVASSTGAMLALELAAVRPEAFTQLVLVSPLGLWVDDDPVADPFGTTLTRAARAAHRRPRPYGTVLRRRRWPRRGGPRRRRRRSLHDPSRSSIARLADPGVRFGVAAPPRAMPRDAGVG